MCFCMEHELSGTFTKYCNNTGFWDQSCFDATLAELYLGPDFMKLNKAVLDTFLGE